MKPKTDRKKLVIDGAEVGDTFTVEINRKKESYQLTQAHLDAGNAPNNTANTVAMAKLIEVLNASSVPEFKEVKWTAIKDDANDANLITGIQAEGPDNGKPITLTTDDTDANNLDVEVKETTKGDGGKNEIYQFVISGTPTSGTFTITIDGVTSAAIDYDETAGDLETKLEAMSNITAVSVTGSNPWSVEMEGNWANRGVPSVSADGTNIVKASSEYGLERAVSQQSAAGKNEIQKVIVPSNATGGTFTLAYEGATTGALSYNMAAATLESNLTGLSTIGSGNVSVTKDSDTSWNIEFTGTFMLNP